MKRATTERGAQFFFFRGFLDLGAQDPLIWRKNKPLLSIPDEKSHGY